MTKRATIKRRGLLAAAAGGAVAAFTRPVGQAGATSGGGDQGALLLGSNNFFKAPGTFSNVANVSSVATVVEASPNYTNYTSLAGSYVFRADARPGGGNVNGLEGYATGLNVGVSGSSPSGWGGFFSSGSGFGLAGQGGDGVGGVFSGGRAAIQLVKNATVGVPTSGSHSAGEMVVDAFGDLFLCKQTGTPGAWVKLSQPTFTTLPTPERFVDTRSNLGGVQGPVAGGTTNMFQMTGRDGQSGNPSLRIPDTATSLVGNLTVVGGPSIPIGSFVTLWPGGPQPTVSNVNVGPGGVVANSFSVGLGSSGGHGTVNVFNQQQADYILDVTGYWA